ncbi:MAG TPA: hypothetical protein VM243_01420 [Phycisphaerae bacterium]|nr:hypothetical protein [Phycisphaerae bacterium]
MRRRAQGGNEWQTTTYRRFPKLALVVDCDSHLILSCVPGRGPGPDFLHLEQAVEEACARRRIKTLLAG